MQPVRHYWKEKEKTALIVCVYTRVPTSAGVGRTGVFITLSIVLERMRYEGVVDIFQTVKMLRTQRPATVQTEVSELSSTITIIIIIIITTKTNSQSSPDP